MSIGISFDDLFCLAASDDDPIESDGHKIAGLGVRMLHSEGNFILESKKPAFGFGDLERDLAALPKPSESSRVPELIGLLEGLGTNWDGETRDGLPYLATLLDATRTQAARLGVRNDLDLKIAVPGVAALQRLRDESIHKPKVRYCKDSLKDCLLFMMEHSSVRTEFEDAGLCAGFSTVSSDWIARLFGADILKSDPEIVDRLKEERSSFILVEVQLNGLLLTPISRSLTGADVEFSRPSLWIPFPFEGWLKEQLHDGGGNGFKDLSVGRRNIYLERFLRGMGFETEPETGLAKEVDGEVVTSDAHGATREGDSVGSVVDEPFRKRGHISGFKSYYLNEDEMALSLAQGILEKIYGDEKLAKTALKDGLGKPPQLDPKKFNGFRQVFDRWDDERDNKNTMEVVGYRLTGSLAAHPILGPVLNKAMRMVLWNPEIQPEHAISNDRVSTIAEAAILAKRSGQKGVEIGTQTTVRSASFWNSVSIDFYEGQHHRESMNREIIVPELGDVTASAKVEKWMKSIGDQVHEDELIALLDAETGAIEVKSPAAGRLISIYMQEGADVRTDNRLAEIDPGNSTKVSPAALTTIQNDEGNLALTRHMIMGNRSRDLGCRIKLGRQDDAQSLQLQLKFGLEEHHVDKAVEVEIRVDRAGKVLVAVLLDGRPFPAESLKRFEGADEDTIIEPTAFGTFEVYINNRHKQFATTMNRLNGNDNKPWAFMSESPTGAKTA
ncbi:biotin/lipoyl-containing protein [Ruegeria arenilitoris]|uniref:biotin/lipoyl-containing protein n=1 Tax=Ruegeria arenilitoris TaxID=1173585 RepID=UPI00147B9E43|nr:lipoyl domain-containing protein [Ruegeria arenilitoris]